MKKLLIVIVGPTAVGKSEVAIELARRIKGEIISCDSRQVYEHLNIGTAKPTKEQTKKIPHHLIDIIKPDEEFNAFLYAQRAHEAISKVHKKKKIPILVGGSGLYLRAVIDGIFPGAGRNEKIRERLEKFSSGALYKRLKEADPKTALRLHPHDKVRIIRALEVHELTGQPISALQKVSKGRKPDYEGALPLAPSTKKARITRFLSVSERLSYYDLTMIGLKRKRGELYQRINRRVEEMIEEGLVEEVRNLLKRGFSKDLIALKGLGYKEIIGYLDGEYDLKEAIRLLKRNSRRFAKRQLTWFNKDQRIHWIEIAEKDLANRIASQIANMVEC